MFQFPGRSLEGIPTIIKKLIKPGNEIVFINWTKCILKIKLFENSSNLFYFVLKRGLNSENQKKNIQASMTKYFIEVIKYHIINYFIYIIFNVWSIFVGKYLIYLGEKWINFSEPKYPKIRKSGETQDGGVIVITKSKI